MFGETEDNTVLYDQGAAGSKLDTVDSGIARVAAITQETIESNVAYDHDVIALRVDHDAVGPGRRYGGDLTTAAVESDGFGDCQRPC